MTAYQNCEVSDVMSVTLPSGVAGEGCGFSIRSENKRPLVSLSFATREDAEQARAEVASAIPFVPKKTVEQQDIQALHRARQRGGREGALFVRNNPGIRGLVVWRAYMCAPARARRIYASRPPGRGAFLPVGSQFSEGTEKSIVTAITDLIEDWIQMRSTLQRQLKMLESSEMYAGDKISDSTIGDTIVRVRRCIDELNSLLKEYAISPRR
jgi:hypothetical protein